MKTQPKANQPLSKPQMAALSIMASHAFKAARARYAVDDETTLDAYRRAGQETACNVASLRDAKQAHYLLIRGYWHTELGNVGSAYDDFLAAGEDQEERRQMWYRLGGQVARLAEGITARHTDQGVRVTPEQAAAESWAYAASICADKYQGRRFHQLTALELSHLGFTVYNRASPMLGKGRAENRNKSQRNGTRQPAQDGGPSILQRARNRFATAPQPGLHPQDGPR